MSSYFDATKPGFDDSQSDSQLNSQLDSQLDSQLIIVKGSVRFAPSPIFFIVLNNPSDLMPMRQHAFALHTSITWSAADYASYWPYVDNVWVHNHTERMTKKKTQKSYWYCRLWKNDADIKSEGHGRRAKRMRLTDPCPMKLALIKRFDEAIDDLISVELNCHVNKKFDSEIQRQHNHTLEFLDNIKINSVIKFSAEKEIAKGYTPAAVNRNMQGVRWEGNYEVLQEAGGRNFNWETVYNAGRNFRKQHPDARILGAKEV